MHHPLTRPGRRRALPVPLGLLAALTLTACGADPADEPADDASASATPHGYVAGAQELPEPQLQLSYLDAEGSAHALDLLTEDDTELGETGAADAFASDGRFLFAVSEDAGEMTIVDTGTWTVDHGDHTHYYRAPAQVAGTLDWSGEVQAASSETLTAVFSPTTGTGVLLDRADLGSGQVTELARIDTGPHRGAVIPLGNRVVVTDPTSVTALDSSGEPLPGDGVECIDPRGGLATRVGVVVSCADGAVLATGTDDGVDFERIPYPAPVADADRAAALDNRPGRPSVAAPAGTGGVWLLDTRAREWQLLPTDTPWVTAVAADDDADRVVGVDTAGRVVVLEPASGTTTASEPLLPVDRLDEVDLQVDPDRAYVNVPGAGQLLEIDYADDVRLARTFPTAVDPAHLAETGR
ncbi:hypothetical protein SAMN03159343_3729 [Klenkia marina]|uniref:ABC transporter n=1 Tax=Klenkia marina TaxID=1960309 RepID=A0A1G4YXL7_9ACTN|nr:hypothetical protein [Klenkia marina]SCX58204.1 hypothetical protein SAMN03159343_3729 [Klenkia marina]